MKRTILFGLLALVGASMWAADGESPMAVSEANPAPQETTWQKVLDKLPKVSGYLQTGYNYNSLGAGSNSFQAKRLRLIMDGNVGAKVSFRLQIEAFNGIAGSTNGNGQKNLQVMDAFATYKFSPAFQVRAGQFYTPMGYENYDISPATLETVDFSNICYRLACRNAISYDLVDYGRDLGVMVLGDVLPSGNGFNYLSYNFAVTNGNLPCKDDNNKSKDIIGALTFRPVKNVNIKAAYNWGEYQGLRAGDSKYQPMSRAIFGAWYNDPKGLDLRAEFGFGASKQDGVDIVKENGAYVLAAYHFGQWLPVVRWDMYKDDVAKYSMNNYNRILVGCTWQPLNNLKVQVNYMYSMYDKDVADASNHGEKSSSQLQVMGLFKF